MERNIGSPMVNTAGFVVKKTGVEGGIRWYLARRPSDVGEMSQQQQQMIDPNLEKADISPANTRRRTSSRQGSQASLPAYDPNRSPPYQETQESEQNQEALSRPRSPSGRTWSQQVWITTSGLGAALSEPGLRTLKYCLKIVRRGFQYLKNLAFALKEMLEDWDKSHSPNQAHASPGSQQAVSSSRDEEDAEITQRMKNLCDEIWRTLRQVCDSVSQYGGALPENAGALVRGQILSVPFRWRRATTETTNGSDPNQEPTDSIGSAKRMLAFAKEGLDMIAQVSGVIEATVESADRWLDSMGRRKRENSESDNEEGPQAKDRKITNRAHERGMVGEGNGG